MNTFQQFKIIQNNLDISLEKTKHEINLEEYGFKMVTLNDKNDFFSIMFNNGDNELFIRTINLINSKLGIPPSVSFKFDDYFDNGEEVTYQIIEWHLNPQPDFLDAITGKINFYYDFSFFGNKKLEEQVLVKLQEKPKYVLIDSTEIEDETHNISKVLEIDFTKNKK